MNNRVKIVLVKSSIVFSGFILAFTTLGFPVLGVILGYEFEAIERTWIILWAFTFLSGTITIFLMFSVKLLREDTPEKIPLVFENYVLLKNFLHQTLGEHGFTSYQEQAISVSEEMNVYIKPSRMWTTDCFSIIRISELTEEKLKTSNDYITEILKKHFQKNNITNTVNLISVFCVDRITPTFRKMLSNNMQQGLKNGRLIAGISFGGKNIYIAKQKDGFAIMRYRKLRKTLLKVLGQGQVAQGTVLCVDTRGQGDGSVVPLRNKRMTPK